MEWMAFITQLSARHDSRPAGWRRLLYALAFGLCAAAAHAGGFEVSSAATQLENDTYQLNARIDYQFSGEVLEALNNGVPLTLRLEVEVQRLRRWWPNETVVQRELRHQLTYHAFSDQYLLRDLNSDKLTIYHTLNLALLALGAVDGYPLLDAGRVEPDQEYRVQLRTALDIEALPAPLRPVAYVTPAWRLSSEWFTCSLTP
jgi:hypothetical protein